MKVATGKVVGGKVVLEGVFLEEGTSVTVLAKDDDGVFELTSEQEADLLLSIAEAERGETVSAEEVLAKLARRHG
jgi:phosphoribosyl-ATP pyrophosphohydrolase